MEGDKLKHVPRILIANRGEIAIRIMRTCRMMGIAAVGVYADEDRGSPHVRAASEAIAIGPSYRDSDRIIAAARTACADAIHPGYGFLAEDADFAEACQAAGFVFIGPSADVIRRMGLKIAAREIAEACGVPVVPAFAADGRIDFPVLIKASAGGGGRGMRLVTDRAQLGEALEAARSEAKRSFGDGTLLIEKYIEAGRHVEVQIFGDHHGNLIHLFERDCSIQRRYQKVIEESPCWVLDAALRERMCDAALKLGRAINYTNAGTVEFLLAPSGEFYFIEVNTRIQVEHPVTELVTGLDLIRLQIEIAEGLPLDVKPVLHGHAIEARLYAEDPDNQFVPSAGTIRAWHPPGDVRVDSGIETGQEIGIRYDPLLAKIIAHGPDRETACARLVAALEETRILGVKTNREYLIEQLAPEKPVEIPARWFEAAAAFYLDHMRPRRLTGVPVGFRNNPFCKRTDEAAVEMVACSTDSITLSMGGVSRTFAVDRWGDEVSIQAGRKQRVFQIPTRYPRAAASKARQAANSPMPGQVLRILVENGQLVQSGEALLVLEAMKMEQTIRTTINGVVQSILVEPGQIVAPGQMLVEIRAQEQTE